MLFSEFLPVYHPYRQLVPFFQSNRSVPLAIASLMRIFEQFSCLSLEAAQAKLNWWEQELISIWVKDNHQNYQPMHPISIELKKIQKIENLDFIKEHLPNLFVQTRQHIERIRYENESELSKFWLGFYGFFLGLLDSVQYPKVKLLELSVLEISNVQAINFGLLNLLTDISQTLSHQRFDIPLTYLSEIHCSASILLQRQEQHQLWQKIAHRIQQNIEKNIKASHHKNHQVKVIQDWLKAIKGNNFYCLSQQIFPKIKVNFFK